MPDKLRILMAGGGTGGHVIPLLAVAEELRARGHEPYFVGTERGAEARLVPAAGFPIQWIRIGGLQGVSFTRRASAFQSLLTGTAGQFRSLRRATTQAVFSLGGYVAGPPVLAALVRRIPIVVMEPNAAPGLTNRWIARYVAKALINFPETARYFPPGRTEVTGSPVREEFFHLPERSQDRPFTVLLTGGSQGSRTLNEAARAAWPKLHGIYLIHQTGAAHYEALRPEFERSGAKGEISAFIPDMAGAYARADLIICRSGAGTVSELAAAGKPSVLIPFPFATDDHQRRNAEEFEKAGAALLFADKDWNGDQMLNTIQELASDRNRLHSMSVAARSLAHPGAARRAADILEEVARNTR